MSETQATHDEESTTVTIAYTNFELERGTDEEIVAYELRNGDVTPDDVADKGGLLDVVYDETLEIDVDAEDVEKHETTLALLESVYHGVERDLLEQVDRTEYRSPMIGDVFIVDDTAYVVARIGFDELESAPELFE